MIPSAFGRFSQTTLELEVVAYRDIQAGEELTLSCECTRNLRIRHQYPAHNFDNA